MYTNENILTHTHSNTCSQINYVLFIHILHILLSPHNKQNKTKREYSDLHKEKAERVEKKYVKAPCWERAGTDRGEGLGCGMFVEKQTSGILQLLSSVNIQLLSLFTGKRSSVQLRERSSGIQETVRG